MRSYPAIERRRWIRTEENNIRHEVLAGLQRYPKILSPKYFYDERGSELFEQICKLEEYYPTRTEAQILTSAIPDVLTRLPGSAIELIEPGSGSSEKTRFLLEQLGSGSTYVPIDISRDFLLKTARTLQAAYPHIKINPVIADFGRFEAVAEITARLTKDKTKLLFFPGSTIGNFTPVEAESLLGRFKQIAGENGWVLIGVDLYKDVTVLERAYNDKSGLTAEFNLNILQRLNLELSADFDLSLFEHHAFFNKTQSRIEMHLVCCKSCVVDICGVPISFKAGESIHTENSYKYTADRFCDLASASGFQVEKIYSDKKNYFGVFLLRV